MFFLAIDLDPFAAGADEVFERGVKVERIAHLVKVRHLQIGALANLAGRRCHVRLQFTEDEFEQGGLAGTVRAEQANFVSAQQGPSESVDDHFLSARMAEAEGDIG